MAVIYETGNHIAQVQSSDNNIRFHLAQKFIKYARQAIKGDRSEIPWIAMVIPTNDEIGLWLSEFPQNAARKVGMGDLSIKKEWEKAIEIFPNYRVFIWSLDDDLQGYDSLPLTIK